MLSYLPRVKKAVGAAVGALVTALVYAQADGFTAEEIGGAVGLAVTTGLGVWALRNKAAE